MDEIRDIVSSIVRGCNHGGLPVSDVLAAFIAKTILENDSSSFSLDKMVTYESKQNIVMQSIERLLERDNPGLETIKMQVDFDSAFFTGEQGAQKSVNVRNKMIATHKKLILEYQMEDGADFESLTAVYRMMFKFLLEFPPKAVVNDKTVEREVAAALESVFPRIGLKTFVELSYREKELQLMELAYIILGIRLFNREQKKGGQGMDNMEEHAYETSVTMATDIENEIAIFSDACDRYQAAIVQVHRIKRKLDLEAEMKEQEDIEKMKRMNEAQAKEYQEMLAAQPKPVKYPGLPNDRIVDRWGQELVNRRQYLSFLRSLQEEANVLRIKMTQYYENIKGELGNVATMVTGKAAVPKEMIYPRFESLGKLWVALWEDMSILSARYHTLQTLSKYRLSFQPTLSEETYVVTVLSSTDSQESDSVEAQSGELEQAEPNLRMSIIDSAKMERMAAAALRRKDYLTTSFTSTARLLTPEDTPDFMMLPLELQGYCPWSLKEASGLLVPGKPSLGVIRYNNSYYVCDHNIALTAFLRNPDLYLDDIKKRAYIQPEYIHLLRIQNWFPKVAIAKLLNNADFDRTSIGGKGGMVDAGTETPTHFVERCIDVNYHWNEWELRRRALKISKLKKCLTTSQQTDESHFRRDNHAQVYLPRIKGTQTKREKGTNPPTKTSYVAGLRGGIDGSKPAISQFVTPADKGGFPGTNAGRVVTLTLDL